MDYPVLLPQLREHLRALRRTRQLTQTQLGERIGVGQVRMADIERDPASISVQQLFEILDALGVRVLLRDDRDPPDGTSDKAGSTRAPEW